MSTLTLPTRESLDEKLRSLIQNEEIEDITALIAYNLLLHYSGESLSVYIKKTPHILVRREVIRRGEESGWRITFVGNNPRGDGPHITIE